MQKCHYIAKCLMCGDAATGKTSLLNQYMYCFFSDYYQRTNGVDFATKSEDINGVHIKMNFWEIGGYQSCIQTSDHYHKNCFAAFIVFDLTSHESFKNVHDYIQCITEKSSCFIILLGNKSDLNAKKVHYSEIQSLLNVYSFLNIYYYDISAKNYRLTQEIFTRVGQLVYNKIKNNAYTVEQLWNMGIKCINPVPGYEPELKYDKPIKNECSIS